MDLAQLKCYCCSWAEAHRRIQEGRDDDCDLFDGFVCLCLGCRQRMQQRRLVNVGRHAFMNVVERCCMLVLLSLDDIEKVDGSAKLMNRRSSENVLILQ